MNHTYNMNNISQKEEIFLNLYTKHKHNETSERIKKTHGHLLNGQMNFESILELGSNYMFMFGKTNSKEMYDFIQKNKVTFSDNKFKSILSVALKREIEVDIDFDKIKEKVFDNYDLVTQQAATFLKEIGCTAKQVNLFTTNCTKMKEIGAELIHDYYLHTHQQLDPKLLEGKHLYSILSEMGNDYDNVQVVFRDAEKKDQWRYEHNLLIMPSKALLMLNNKAVDLINNLGGGYEISTLVKDKAFFQKIKQEHMLYTPSSQAYKEIMKQVERTDDEGEFRNTKRRSSKLAS
jgi:hypothetical protein